jgi:cytochrome b
VPGHNPLGALSVIALLLAMATQVALGLFAVDVDGIESGPLSHLVSFDTGRTCAKLHHQPVDQADERIPDTDGVDRCRCVQDQ